LFVVSVIRVVDRFEEFLVSPDASDIFGRAGAGSIDAAGIEILRSRRASIFDGYSGTGCVIFFLFLVSV